MELTEIGKLIKYKINENIQCFSSLLLGKHTINFLMLFTILFVLLLEGRAKILII